MKISNVYKTRVTQKGQITLSKKLRDRLNIKTKDTVFLYEEDGQIRIRPVVNFFELGGKMGPKKKSGNNILKARESLEKSYERV
jgi:AbrB family looped-hinge helix DNA binding protein